MVIRLVRVLLWMNLGLFLFVMRVVRMLFIIVISELMVIRLVILLRDVVVMILKLNYLM